MVWSKSRFQHSFEIFPRVLREVFPLLLPLSALLWGLEIFVSQLNKDRFANPYDSSTLLLILAGLGAVVLESLITVVWILYVSRSTQRQMKNGVGEKSLSFLKRNFHQNLIEYVRAMISVGIYTLFLIIPGLIRWVKLTFTCFVAAFDPEYQEGKKDALETSSQIVKGSFLPLLFLLLFQMSFPFILEEIAKSLSMGLVAKVLLYGAAWMISLYFAIYLALTYFALASYKLRNS